ncbi:MAG: MCE family protein [Rhodospirillales bacterium]|nr:MCE family protein [Rhodospirillales bacterium]
MTEPDIETAIVRKKGGRRISLIWVIPAITLAIGAWLVWDTYARRGPVVTITFDQGDGLVAGQSVVKHRDVTLGTVTGVHLTHDMNHVEVTVQMKREATPLITDKTKFWIVRPRFFAGSLSGLGTLLSGPYIDLLPAAAGSKPATHFVGREDPPVLQSAVPGRTFLLRAPRIGSITLGAPVFFRDLNVGQVLGWDVADMARYVTIHVFVRAPFDAYVHDNSRFWNASGLSLNLGAQGVHVQVQSLNALLLGGVAFTTPQDAADPKEAVADHQFPLYANYAQAAEAVYHRKINFVSFFSGSVAGLDVGAPVTLHGLKIGQVSKVDMAYDPKAQEILAHVHFYIQPGRIGNVTDKELSLGPLANVRALVARGARAQIDKSSLLTGTSEIAIVEVPDAPPVEVHEQDGDIVFPTTPAPLASIRKSVVSILAKINAMPIDKMSESLSSTLAGLDRLTNGPNTRQAVASLSQTLDQSQRLVKQLNTDVAPALKTLPQLTRELNGAVGNLNKMLKSADHSYGGQSHFSHQLDRLMTQLNDMALSFRALADLLASHPEALIRGRTQTGVQP